MEDRDTRLRVSGAYTPQVRTWHLRRISSRQTSQANVPLRPGHQHDAQDPQIKLEVGRVRWRDLFGLRAIRQRLFLNIPNRSLASGQPAQAAFRQLMPFVRANDRVFVARNESTPVGYAVFTVIRPDGRWQLEGVGANLGVYQLEPVWDELIRAGIVAAGLEGTRRIFARVSTGSDLARVLTGCGFTAYDRETILAAPMHALRHSNTRIRRQQHSDVWAIHQLAMSTVPQPVQSAEALTSHHWDIRRRLVSTSIQSGWIMDDGNQIAAYVRAESRPDTHILEFMIEPGSRDLFPELVSGALSELAASPPRQVLILVRAHQQEFIRPLLNRGFHIQSEQDLYVKYTTAVARLPVAPVVTFPQEVKEPAGKRVPTFLKGASGDPASESS
jgi:hypothetical protein